MNCRTLLTRSNNIKRDSFFWNMTGSGLMAFQSVFLLVILTRTVGLKESGIFTIAYANANLFLAIGKYFMHNYQVSDTAEQFSVGDYRLSRYITTALMLLCAAVYAFGCVFFGGYTPEKSMIILWACVFKAVDALEDVYCSLYQQRGRLDLAGKVMTWRLVLTLLFFAAGILLTKDLLWTLIASTVFTALVCFVLNRLCYPLFRETARRRGSMRQVAKLLWVCFPLFLGNFLSLYLTNAPKYAIDNLLSDELQACYGFIAMPVFVINLLSNFIFSPVIRQMSEKWQERDLPWIRRQLLWQCLLIVGISAVCIAGAALIGIPVLSALYSTDLSAYKAELLVLLGSGGFLAISSILQTTATIMRRQKATLLGYCICAVAAFTLAYRAVDSYGIMGAAALSMVLMALLCVCFVIVVAIGLRHNAGTK